MKELVTKVGGKDCYSTDIDDAQNEVLEPLQKFFSRYGACLIEGCAITANGSDWDIAAGIVVIQHATDGVKVCRFPGATAVTLPGYFSVSKTTNTGPYNAGASTDDVSYTYAAAFTTGAAPSSSDLYLEIPSPGADATTNIITIKNIEDAIGEKATEDTLTLTGTTGVVSAKSLKLTLNRAARTLHIRGTATLTNFTIIAGIDQPIGLEAPANVPLKYRPAAGQYFKAYPVESASTNNIYYKDFNNVGYVTDFTCYMGTNGNLHVRFRKPATSSSVTSVNIAFNAIIPLD